MSRWYVDTSAAIKLIAEEPESDALSVAVEKADAELVSCLMLETELRRAASRAPELTQAAVSRLLEGVTLHELPPTLFAEAGLLPGPQLRSLDALHLAAAIRLGVDCVVTYDCRMAEAATELGMTVMAPA